MSIDTHTIEGFGDVLLKKPGAVIGGHLGAFQWTAGPHFAPWLVEKFKGTKLKILEIGSGLGLLSICLAKFGHEMICTDGDEPQLPYMQENATLNNVNYEVAKLWWGDEQDIANLKQHTFDYIIGADLIAPINHEWVKPLVYSCQELCSPHTEILIAQESRKPLTDWTLEQGFTNEGFQVNFSEPWGPPFYLYTIKQQ